jgi:ferredoxin
LPADSHARLLADARRFCQGESGAGDLLGTLDESWLPAVLYQYQKTETLREQYPLFLTVAEDRPRCAPVDELLRDAADSFAPGPDDARILKDNLLRLELEVRALAAGARPSGLDAAELLAGACDALEKKLALKGDAARALRDGLAGMRAAIPPGLILAMSPRAALQMYLYTAAAAAERRSERLREIVSRLRGRLRDLLAAERAKSTGARSERSLAGAIGDSGAALLDAAALSRLLAHAQRAEVSDEGRLARIGAILGVLEHHLGTTATAPVRVVSRESLPDGLEDPRIDWQRTTDVPSAAAADVFDSVAAEHGAVIGAIRAARLELAGEYDAATHGSSPGRPDWRSFSPEELLLLPPVIAVERPRDLAAGSMIELSRLLLSGRPVGVQVEVAVATDPGAPAEEPIGRYRLELAYLGVSHREALVNQSAAARPAHLLEGYIRSLGATHASLHVVMSPLTGAGREPRLGAWLHGGAAIEGRGHPLFHYDPGAGETWAKRLDFSMNPSPEEDWPACEVAYDDASGSEGTLSTPFTFADFCLLEPAMLGQFRVLPPGLESEMLVPASEFLAVDSDLLSSSVPYVWATDEEGVLHRVAFTRRLAFACRDRLDFWHTLQELSGARNEHVREAVERERERLETAFAAERTRLGAEHTAEIERVRREAAGESLRRLAEALVSTDPASMTTGPARTPNARSTPPTSEPAPSAEAPTAAPEAASAIEAPQAEEDAGFDEPWVETALCTSCNDCTNINSKVFVYNANKQVVIGDPRAGTYAQIVAAAEKCPAHCIHPAKPLNPDEPGLAELVKRAKPFN